MGFKWVYKLLKRNAPFRNFLNDDLERSIVFAWVPAISIYFNDLDGNSLEFLGILDGKTRPEKGIISYDEWLELENKWKYYI